MPQGGTSSPSGTAQQQAGWNRYELYPGSIDTTITHADGCQVVHLSLEAPACFEEMTA